MVPVPQQQAPVLLWPSGPQCPVLGPVPQKAPVSLWPQCHNRVTVATYAAVPPQAPAPVWPQCRKSAENDCYIYIPHPLIDPVLAHVQARLQKFYSQTFWANNAVFECCLSAMALAKRGFNVDRCFIGESPGGVGQSLFSLHIDAILGSMHFKKR